MTIGVNPLLWTSWLGPAHLGVLQMREALGYDGVEVSAFSGAAADYDEIGRMVAGEGLAGAVAGTRWPGVDPLSGAVSERAAGAAQLRWRVDCAQALGAEVGAWPFHQPLGQFSGRGVTGAQWRRMVESQRTMSDYAGDLRRAIEPLNRFECCALNLAADAAGLVAAVGRPNSGYLYDRFPAHIEERDPVAVRQATIPAVSHVDVSENDRRTPGRGHAGFRPALRALKAALYDHWISVEAFGQALPDIAAATKVWRPHFPSETQRVTEAIGLIRQVWTE